MTCGEIREHLSAYADGVLDQATKSAVESHLELCPECTQELSDILTTIQLVKALPEVKAPAHFRQGLMTRLHTTSAHKHKKSKHRYWISTVAVAAVMLLAVALSQFTGQTGLLDGGLLNMGSKSDSAMMADERAYGNQVTGTMGMPEPSSARGYTENADQPMDGNMGFYDLIEPSKEMMEEEGVVLQVQERKIIKDGFMNIEVASYQEAAATAERIAVQVGGYIQDSSISTYRSGSFSGELTLRVPEDRFETVMEEISGLGKLRDKRLNGRDVTMEYIDVEGRLKVSREKEERLLALLTKAEQLEDVLNIERELSYTRGDIEQMEGRMRYLNQATGLATIKLTLTEVEMSAERITAPGLAGVFQEAGEAFILTTNKLLRLLGDVVVLGGSSLPILVVVVAIAIAAFYSYRFWRKK